MSDKEQRLAKIERDKAFQERIQAAIESALGEWPADEARDDKLLSRLIFVRLRKAGHLGKLES